MIDGGGDGNGNGDGDGEGNPLALHDDLGSRGGNQGCDASRLGARAGG